MRLTRRYRFSASHRLHRPDWPDQTNRLVYGKCNNPYGHGHDYLLEVTVAGRVDPHSGRLVDLARLDALVQGEVIGPFDHANLNEEVPAFARRVPTTENLALEIRDRLVRRWADLFPEGGPELEKIKLWETKRNIFELIVRDHENR
jgi:6-pyruvoyltetrahydropterin/6-carboxytetrahydropterin synthase